MSYTLLCVGKRWPDHGRGVDLGLGTGVDGIGNGGDSRGIGVNVDGWGFDPDGCDPRDDIPDQAYTRGYLAGRVSIEAEVRRACAGLYQFLAMAGRCNAIQPAYAQMMQAEQQNRMMDDHKFTFFECLVDGDQWQPYGKVQQEQLRQVLRKGLTHTTTLLQYGNGRDYGVLLIMRPDGNVVGAQVNVRTGTTRQIRGLMGHGGAWSRARTPWQL